MAVLKDMREYLKPVKLVISVIILYILNIGPFGISAHSSVPTFKPEPFRTTFFLFLKIPAFS